MAVLSPPPGHPRPDELEALIREARALQRKRRLGGAVVVAVLAGAALGIYSIAGGTSPSTMASSDGGTAAVKSGRACGMRVVGTRILASDGAVLYRDPAKGTMWSDIKCSGATVWAIFVNGIGTNVEQYIGVRSPDRGHTWRIAFGTGTKVAIGNEVGPWTLDGSRAAYFASTCMPCSVGSTFGTVSITVTKDGGQTFHVYAVPGLTGYSATRVRISGNEVTVEGRRVARKTNSPPYEIYRHKVVRLRVA